MKELNDSIQRHAATKHKWIDTSFLLTSAAHKTHNVLPVIVNKTAFNSVKRRIEYYSDDDDDSDHDDDNDYYDDNDNDYYDDDDNDHDDDDVNDTTFSLNRSELQLVSPSATPSGHEHDAINLNHSPSPNNHQDSLAEKIASYVAASSDGSSPDSKVMNTIIINQLLYMMYNS